MNFFVPVATCGFLKPEESLYIYSSLKIWDSTQDGKRYLHDIPEEVKVLRRFDVPNSLLSFFSCLFITSDLHDMGSNWDPLDYKMVPFDFIFSTEWKKLFDELVDDWQSNGYFAHIVVTRSLSRTPSSSGNQQKLELHLLGQRSCFPKLELDLNCMLHLKKGKFVTTFECGENSMIPLLAGKNGINWSHFSSSFGTLVLAPRFGLRSGEASSKLFLSSSTSGSAILSKDNLEQKMTSLKKSIVCGYVSGISPIKLAFLKHLYPPKRILDLMWTHSCFIDVTLSKIRIQTTSSDLLALARKHLVRDIVSELSECTLWVEKKYSNDYFQNSGIEILRRLASDNNTIVATNKERSSITLVGFHKDIERALNEVSKTLDICTAKISFELDLIYKDFISGKKNGKLVKIMESNKCAISLNNHKSGEMQITLESHDIIALMKSFSLILKEVPCELSFFIPEAYHRPVIGSGGSVIQTIMRKYNVFIQFSNSFQLPQDNWSFTRYDNVVIRCPAKNSKNMESAKNQLLTLSDHYMKIQGAVYMDLSPCQYKYLIHSNKTLSFISALEKSFSCYIAFPQEEPTKGFKLGIFAGNSTLLKAANKLVSHFGREFKLSLKTAILNLQFSQNLLLSLYALGAFVSTIDKEMWLVFHPQSSNKLLDEIFFLLEEFLSRTNNGITSKKEINHLNFLTFQYELGKGNSSTISPTR